MVTASLRRCNKEHLGTYCNQHSIKSKNWWDTRARRAANHWVPPVPPRFDMEVVVSTLPCHWYPRLAPLVPPQAIGALIPSRAVAQFHPAAIHFVSTQTQLPDSCDQAAPLSEEIEVLNEAAFSWLFLRGVCVVWKKGVLTVWESFRERFKLFFFDSRQYLTFVAPLVWRIAQSQTAFVCNNCKILGCKLQ